MSDTTNYKFGPSSEELECFNEKANEIFEAFLEDMKDDPKYIRPYNHDEDPSEAENCKWMWSGRAVTLIERMLDRLMGLATNKFGAYAIDIDITSHLYQEF